MPATWRSRRWPSANASNPSPGLCMNPISAIRQFAIPDPQAAYSALLPKAGLDASAIGPISSAQIQELPGAFATPSAQPSSSFGQVLGHMVNEVSAKQTAAGDAVSGLMSG